MLTKMIIFAEEDVRYCLLGTHLHMYVKRALFYFIQCPKLIALQLPLRSDTGKTYIRVYENFLSSCASSQVHLIVSSLCNYLNPNMLVKCQRTDLNRHWIN